MELVAVKHQQQIQSGRLHSFFVYTWKFLVHVANNKLCCLRLKKSKINLIRLLQKKWTHATYIVVRDKEIEIGQDLVCSLRQLFVLPNKILTPMN